VRDGPVARDQNRGGVGGHRGDDGAHPGCGRHAGATRVETVPTDDRTIPITDIVDAEIVEDTDRGS